LGPYLPGDGILVTDKLDIDANSVRAFDELNEAPPFGQAQSVAVFYSTVGAVAVFSRA